MIADRVACLPMVSGRTLRGLRRKIGLSQHAFGLLLGLSGKEPDRPIRAMEQGDKQVSGPISKLAKYMSQGLSLNKHVPDFVIAGSCHDDEAYVVLHMAHPRFVALLVPKGHPEYCTPIGLGDESLHLLEWIDEPADDDDSHQALLRCLDWIQTGDDDE